jgi:hypothetical protein
MRACQPTALPCMPQPVGLIHQRVCLGHTHVAWFAPPSACYMNRRSTRTIPPEVHPMFKTIAPIGLAAALAVLPKAAFAVNGNSSSYGSDGPGPTIPAQSLTPFDPPGTTTISPNMRLKTARYGFAGTGRARFRSSDGRGLLRARRSSSPKRLRFMHALRQRGPNRAGSRLEDLRRALLEFRETYNNSWLIERHGYLTPEQFRQKQLQPNAMAA